ncbi:sensor histidine kinase [Sphaerisporangium aureirubrum]|uniref:histidine kinase n=1 Tax=Sphaerisporangium aureirubrum TaxID=1544736 RepID=A0ABW1NSA9_9ACTN
MLTGFARSLALTFITGVNMLLAVLILFMHALCFGLGVVFLYPATVRLVRVRAAQARDLAKAWSGVQIATPYRPAPPPPMPGRDGWYREGVQRYRTSLIPRFNLDFNWVLKDPATWRDFAWLLTDPLVGLAIAAAPLFMIGGGALLVGTGRPLEIVAGLLLLAASFWAAAEAPGLHGRWTRLLLAPTAKARLAGEVRHLNRTRTDAVDSQAAELRRIERDLHDGAQARLVAIGMTLGAAEELVEKDPAAAKALIAKVREASAASLIELRQVVRGIHPPVLAERGLGDAVRALALDSPLDITVRVDLPTQPEAPVESAAYFVISELLANAGRHSGARAVTVDISHRGPALRITVTDDGYGGADPSRGSGLRGIERRLAAFDGVLALHSPLGGPTTAMVEIPRALAVDPCSVLPQWRRTMMNISWGLFWLPLFPQGLVPAFLKLFQVPERSWFLALYLPAGLQWPVILGMISLGGGMVAFAARSLCVAKRAEREAIA